MAEERIIQNEVVDCPCAHVVWFMQYAGDFCYDLGYEHRVPVSPDLEVRRIIGIEFCWEAMIRAEMMEGNQSGKYLEGGCRNQGAVDILAE